MRIATWNIFWLGDRTGKNITRSESDHQLIAQVIRHLRPDVLVLEEIVDPLVLEQILGFANTPDTDYTIKSDDSNWLTSDPNPLDTTSEFQKLFVCINNKTVEYLRGAAIRGGPSGRRPYAVRLRERSSGKEVVVVGVHLRSGYPVFLDEDDAAVRLKQAEALTRWVQGMATAENSAFPKPDCDDVCILGDFNAERNDPNHSLAPLTKDGMANWLWSTPAPDGNHWETALYAGDRLVIDFILFSESLRKKVISPAGIYAWDHDPQMGGSSEFHHGSDGSGNLKGYEVSDHRPVVAEVKL